MPNCLVVKDFFMVELKMRICQAHIQYTHITCMKKMLWKWAALVYMFIDKNEHRTA